MVNGVLVSVGVSFGAGVSVVDMGVGVLEGIGVGDAGCAPVQFTAMASERIATSRVVAVARASPMRWRFICFILLVLMIKFVLLRCRFV